MAPRTIAYVCDRCGAREPSQKRAPGIYPLPVGWALIVHDDEVRCAECRADDGRGSLPSLPRRTA